MSTTTPKLGLIKPDGGDYVDVNDLNTNFDKIDGMTATDVGLPNLLNNPNNIKLYTNFNQIGITVTETTTLKDIATSLPVGSILLTTTGLQSLYTFMPGSHCVLEVYRGSSASVHFKAIQNNTAFHAWECYFNTSNDATTGWKEIAPKDEFLPLSGGTMTGAQLFNMRLPYIQLNDEQQNVSGMLSLSSNQVRLESRTDSNNRAFLAVNDVSNSVENALVFSYAVNGAWATNKKIFGEHNMASAPTTYDIPVSIANFSANGFNKYWKDKEGYVHITFNIKSASASNSMSDGNVLFTLPAGFRPSTKQGFYGGYMATQTSSTRTACEFIINTDGTCVIYKGGTSCAYAMFSCSYYVG